MRLCAAGKEKNFRRMPSKKTSASYSDLVAVEDSVDILLMSPTHWEVIIVVFLLICEIGVDVFIQHGSNL